MRPDEEEIALFIIACALLGISVLLLFGVLVYAIVRLFV